MSIELKEGKVYNFSTLAPAILGARLESAKLEAILTYYVARKFENIDVMFRQIYPLLPAETPDDVKGCTYYLFTTPSGAEKVIADQWIDTTTLDLVDGISFRATFTNKTTADLQRIRDLLSAMGETNFTLEIIQ